MQLGQFMYCSASFNQLMDLIRTSAHKLPIKLLAPIDIHVIERRDSSGRSLQLNFFNYIVYFKTFKRL